MTTNSHRIKDGREVITHGNSQGVTVDLDQLESAGIPVGTEVVVNHLDDEPGIKLHPPKDDQIYHRDKLRQVIQMGNSQGVTIKREDLVSADMPVGTDVDVIELDGESGLEILPQSE